jgi:hypothetical protein
MARKWRVFAALGFFLRADGRGGVGMTRDGSITPADLVGKLDWLVVSCDKCGRHGRYVARLVRLGPNAKLTDWLAGITHDCPKRRSVDMSDQCGACCPDLPKVM